MKLDLSKLKHVKSDDKTTTLQHKDGHQIVLAHSALSKDNQAQLKALSGISRDAATPAQASEQKAQNVAANPQSRPDRGFGAVIAKAEGGEVSKPASDAKPAGDAAPGCKVVSQSKQFGNVIMCDATGGRIEVSDPKHVKFCAGCGGPVRFAEGTPDGDVGSQSASPAPAEDNSFLSALKKSASQVLGTDEDTGVGSEAATKGSTPEETASRTEYNKMMMAHDPSTRFGPNGEAPDNFDASKYPSAQSTAAEASRVQDMHATEGAEDIDAENKIRAQAGLPPKPGGTSPAPDVSGANQEANAVSPDGTNPAPASDSSQGAPGPKPMDAEGMYMQGMSDKLAGAKAQADAQGNLGTQQAAQLSKMVEAEKEATDQYNAHFAELDKERQGFMHDIQNGHIDPNKYWTGDEHGNGGHSKIMAGIGMLLAGFNPTTNPNAAIEYIKNQMDMNLKAQERNLSSKENLLSANLHQFGNLKDATAMTRIMQHDMLANQLAQAAATAQSPMAKAAAMQAAGQIKQEAAPMMQNFAMRRAMMNLASGGADGASDPDKLSHQIAMISTLNPEQGKIYRDAFVPGVGLSKSLTAIPQAARDELIAHQKLQNMGEDLLQYSKTHTNIIPGTKEWNIGVQKAAIMQQAVREGLLGTVFRESEKPLLNKLVQDNPANAFKTINSDPKIRTLLESNKMAADTIKQNYNLPVSKAAAPQSQDSGPQYKTVNGVKYMRGPNGEAIPVK